MQTAEAVSRSQSARTVDHTLQECIRVTEMRDQPRGKIWNRIHRSQTGSRYRSAPRHCRTNRWDCTPEGISKGFVVLNAIPLDLPAAEPSSAGCAAPGSA